MDAVDQADLRELLDRQAITRVLMRYSRSMDRKDWDGVSSVYWPDATDDHILYTGDVAGLVDHCAKFTVDVGTVHFLGNNLIDFDGESSAFSETYYIAYHDLPDGEGRTDMILWGRYLDRMERRGKEWRIAARTLTIDAFTNAPGTAVWNSGMFEGLRTRGREKPRDPLYALHPEKVDA